MTMTEEEKEQWIEERTAIYIYDGEMLERYAANRASNDWFKEYGNERH